MNRKHCMASLCLLISFCCHAQRIHFQKLNETDSVAIARQMPVLANEVLAQYQHTADQKNYLDDVFRLQILAGRYTDAFKSIANLRGLSKNGDQLLYKQHELFAQTKLKQASGYVSFSEIYRPMFRNMFAGLSNKDAVHFSLAFITRSGINEVKKDFTQSLTDANKNDSLDIKDALILCKNYYLFNFYQQVEAISKKLLNEEFNKRYIIRNELIKTNDGASIAAVVVRLKGVTDPQPVVLQYTIYADSTAWSSILEPALHGYTGVMAYTRGKGLSPDQIVPYENDGKDANEVIDWISKQSWCNGKIGMYGGSYNGFTQWAAAKYHHPALKTIVPYVAAMSGLGLPMENNVFINANYGWFLYVTNNKYLDNVVYYNPQRWRSMNDRWYTSGVAYNKLDSIDGTPNPLLQRWLKHPGFDRYWQQQIPYQKDYANINIPVLSVTGYYDDGQISALHYLQEHLKYNPRAEHYLIIGPYDHFGAQRGGYPVLRDYAVDSVALINTRDITFQWLDHILKGGKKPTILQGRVNFEVMGANKWEHAASIPKMANTTLNLYLTNKKEGDHYILSDKKTGTLVALNQEVNLADHQTSNNNNYYPYPIIKKELDHSTGLFFMSQPFDKPVEVNGMFGGSLKAMINKKDMDIGVSLYEVMPNGDLFDLSYFLGRASYAEDMSVRRLLQPGKIETIPLHRSRMVSRQLSKGSRLLVILDINKNSFAQVNYGTGKDVSTETVSDGKIPLRIHWYNDSFISVPVKQ